MAFNWNFGYNLSSLKCSSFTQCTFDDSIVFLQHKHLVRVFSDGTVRTYSCVNPPSPRRFASLCQFKTSLYLFGGIELDSNSALRDTWVVNLDCEPSSSSLQWTQLRPSGDLPPPLYGATMFNYLNFLLIFGGCRADGQATDSLYIFDLFSPFFRRCTISIPDRATGQKWPSSRALSSFFIQDDYVFILFGCSRVPSSVSPTSESSSIASLWGRTLGDVWKLKLPTLHTSDTTFSPVVKWESVKISGAHPSNRAGASVCFHPPTSSLLILGGFSTFPRVPCQDAFMLNTQTLVCTPLRPRGHSKPVARCFGSLCCTDKGFMLSSGLAANLLCSDLFYLEQVTRVNTSSTPLSSSSVDLMSSRSKFSSTSTPRSNPNSTPRGTPYSPGVAAKSIYFPGIPSLDELIPTLKSPFSRPNLDGELVKPLSPPSEPAHSTVVTKSTAGFSPRSPLGINSLGNSKELNSSSSIDEVDHEQSILLLKSLISVAENLAQNSSETAKTAVQNIRSNISILIDEISCNNSTVAETNELKHEIIEDFSELNMLNDENSSVPDSDWSTNKFIDDGFEFDDVTEW
ncbi:hypothetical protein RCL1_004871 [Eukaryota sp. TZLM3-RCL]